jgi:DNA-binding NtrC family response regulator
VSGWLDRLGLVFHIVTPHDCARATLVTPRFEGVAESVLLGDSPVMRRVRDQIATLAPLDWHVRIEGPTGSGKSVAARLLHDLSSHARGPFVLCSLAMLPDHAELSELVGHRRGAFTGAVEDRVGKVEDAHMGTLFLEELGTASPRAQEILLQLVDTGTFSRMGESRVRTVKVRFVSATNESLVDLVTQGRFRADLYHRLGLLVVQMPALAEHREDIPELAEHVLVAQCVRAGRPAPRLPGEVVERLLAFPWPGNVRQLASALQYFVAFGQLPDMIQRASCPPDWRDRVDEVLRKHRGKKAPTAAELGVSRETLYEELRRRHG